MKRKLALSMEKNEQYEAFDLILKRMSIE